MRINTLETTPNACRPGLATEWALLALLATLWGASYTFIKIGVATIPPLTLIVSRTLVAGLLLLAVLRLRGVRLPRDAASWRRFMLQACRRGRWAGGHLPDRGL
jgi:drug/metabolite transporter (DMT)-like permease